MKNIKKILTLIILLVSVKTNAAVNGMIIDYMHNKILERTVPEFKLFNDKIRILFKANQNEKSKIKNDIKRLGSYIILKSKKKLENKNTTLAERQLLSTIIRAIKEKIKKLD